MSEVTFADLGLAEPLLRALSAAKYTVPTPIQARTIPALLQGRDVLGIAQTGTGKTAAFALPILHHLSATKERAQPKSPRALILAPARELAVQIARSFETYGYGLGLRLCTVVGGLGYARQIETLQRGADILVATPGRLLDLIERGNVKLGHVKFFVLDEADRMFDMGFIRDVRRISQMVAKDRQTLLFSATMPGDINKLANEILNNPEKVEIAPQGRTVDRIDQRVYFVNSSTKRALLSHLLTDAALERVIVFTRTKRGANRVAEALEDQGVKSEAIHGNKSQNARQKALDNFTRGKARVLVATDLASRGIDVTGVTHVINFELPADAESYVHRIGRTARAGASGIALSFCDGSERGQLRSIEKLTNQRIAVVPTPSNEDMPPAPPMRPRAEREAHDSGENEQRNGRFRPAGRSGGGSGRGGPGGGGRRSFGDRPSHDRTGHDASRGDRPPVQANAEFRGTDFRDRPQSDRPQGDRPQGDRPRTERPFNDRPRGDRPQGDRPYGDRPRAERPHNDRPHGDRPHGDRPQGDRPRGDRPQGDRPYGDRPRAERPHTDRPHGDRPQGDRPANVRSYVARPQGDRPQGDRPHNHADRPAGDRPQGDRPQGDRPRPAWKGRKFGGGGGRGRAA